MQGRISEYIFMLLLVYYFSLQPRCGGSLLERGDVIGPILPFYPPSRE